MTKQISPTSFTMSLNETREKFIYTDEQLMKRFQKGDENAYSELVNRYKDKLINFIYNYVGDIDSAEDIVQDTMIKLYQKKQYYKEIAKFSTWLYTIAKNLANTELRKRKRRKITFLSQLSKDGTNFDLSSNENNVGDDIHTDITTRLIQKAINELQDKFREVIILRDIQELSYGDISSIVNVPIGTVKSRINRARLQLQLELNHLNLK